MPDGPQIFDVSLQVILIVVGLALVAIGAVMLRERRGTMATRPQTGWVLISLGVSLEVIALFIESITA